MKRITLYIFFSVLTTVSLFAQNDVVVKSDTFIVRDSNTFRLSGIAIIEQSVRVFVRERQLTREQFKFNSKLNEISVDSASVSLLDTLIVTYNERYTGLEKKKRRRKLVIKSSPDEPDTIRIVRQNKEGISTKNIFGNEISKSGTIFRGFTVGTNKDFSVSSGLRLQLAGKLSKDLEIVAALTDENTPIQPEGNTERLEELDKVFIEVRHPSAVGVFGDYEYNVNIGEFNRISRKLQGLKGEVNAFNSNLTFVLAGSRGKYNTNEFLGNDGVQGPYRLSGENNERNIIVIAGSEKVYLDGKKMIRGENNDYVIEYANSEITFTPNRLITSASRIIVDFEYTDRKFDRNFAGINLSSKLSDKFSFHLNLTQEGDDKDNPIDFSFSDSELNILRSAGDDPNKASIQGVSLAPADSNGIRKGAYSKIDTVIDGMNYAIYRYSPGSVNAIYNVVFSYVGSGKGDYIKQTLGNYKFIGIGEGNYQPVRFLAMPKLRQNASLLINYRPVSPLSIQLEASASAADANRFSELDDSDNNGFAYNFKLGYAPPEFTDGDRVYGKIDFKYRERFKNKRFLPMYRIDEIEFDRNYNSTGIASGDERLREMSLNYSLSNSVLFDARYGSLNRGGIFSSDRLLANSNINQFGFSVKHNLDYVASKNGNFKSDWMRQNGSLEYSSNMFSPGISFLYENKIEKPSSTDSIGLGSLKYEELSPFIRITPFKDFNMIFRLTNRKEYFPIAGKMKLESKAFGNAIDINYRSGKAFQSEFTFTRRSKNISDEYKRLGRSGTESILIRNRTRTQILKGFLTGSIYYEAATQKTSKLEKVFIKVTKGTGNYIYLGDLNNNGIAEDTEYEPVVFDGEYILVTIPSDELVPVVDLKANTRWLFNFGRLSAGRGFWNDVLSPLSMETFYRVEENSTERETKKIYLLHSGSFLNDSTTIRGFIVFQNDVHLFRNSREFSIRYRFTQRRSLNQFSGGPEKGFFKQQNLRVRFRMIEEISNATEISVEDDFLSAPLNNRRSRLIKTTSFKTDFSYKPIRNIEVGFRISASESEDGFPLVPTKINANGQLLRLIFAFANRGRIRAEAERIELLANVKNNYIPFEITRGNRLGKNYLWRLSMEYKLASNLQISANYDGRVLGGSDAVHTMRAEAKAYF